MLQTQDVLGSSSASPQAILAKALSYRHAGALHPVINIPEWHVGVGERVFLQGASGMGKSTLLQLLSGLLIGSGSLRVAGVELNQLSAAKRDRFRAQTIGLVFQQFNLIPYLSSLDNVVLAALLAGQAHAHAAALARSLLSDTGLAAKLWQQPASTLSIGQQQRVAIARALINAPHILLFDEPTSALDEVNRNLFMQILMRHLEAHPVTTTIFVSHDTRLESYFEKSICLSELSTNHAHEGINNAD